MYREPVIPETIVVHLGPPKENARNIRVDFIEYIKNVASGELYPNWPEEALRANIIAIISFTLNRLYNEWYRSQGYPFDITSSSQYDQSFSENRQFFERIYRIVDDVFQQYIVREGQIQPLFASYCDGKVSTCNGLSQWGSVSLANQGKTSLQILKYYYGNNIKVVEAELSSSMESFPGKNLKLGDIGNDIRILKKELNRIGENYPAIPVIIYDNVFFDVSLENAVKAFQKAFSLPATGIVDRATWYRIKYYYNAVKRISDLYSEGVSQEDVILKYPDILEVGDSGKVILNLHYYLSMISCFNDMVLPAPKNVETYTEETRESVLSFQTAYGLPKTGKVNRDTWNKLISVYREYIDSVPENCRYSIDEFFKGRYLSLGMEGEDVLNLQRILYLICEKTHEIPGVIVSGEYDSLTEKSILKLQKKLLMEENGVVGPTTWDRILTYKNSLF